MQIGRRIYYELSTGNIIQDTGERAGSIVETTQEEDFASYVALSTRVPSSVGVIQLNYGQYADNFAQYPYSIDTATSAIIWGATAYGQSLGDVQSAKIAQLKIIESDKLKTFMSSALGSPHTYLSGESDMLLLTGEFVFINSALYDNSSPDWYTIEDGNVVHTKGEFNQVYVDGRANVQTVKYHRANLEAQVNAAATVSAVNAIVW
jgi:hypothetical protein